MIEVISVHRVEVTEEGVDRWTVEFLTGLPSGSTPAITADELPADVRAGLRAWLDTTKETP